MKPYHLYICLILLACVGIVGCGGGSGSGGGFLPPIGIPIQPTPPEEPQPPSKTCQIDLWGDSVLYGGYDTFKRLEEPVALFLTRSIEGADVRDHSRNGDSAYFAQFRFLQKEPAPIVVLEFGINDVGNNFPYEASMRSLIDYAKSKGSTVIITGFSQGQIANRNQGNEIAERLALEYGALFADWGSVEYNEGDTFDGVHPKQEYSTRLARRLYETIKPIECKS